MSKVDLSRLLQLFTSIYGYLRYIKKCFVLIGIAESMDHRRCLWCVACIFLILALQRPQSIHDDIFQRATCAQNNGAKCVDNEALPFLAKKVYTNTLDHYCTSISTTKFVSTCHVSVHQQHQDHATWNINCRLRRLRLRRLRRLRRKAICHRLRRLGRKTINYRLDLLCRRCNFASGLAIAVLRSH
nr:uncharacterized protein LOC109754952 [Aegilops tauschii subsp. strangulata]XP_045089329.1 uncharacterized protein LOC109754952 [Aegilops tauschii subsp. strangulata]XP_045089330.1 uncharacterized protein LOC109754952 [Aegilops tauschii subsp. strangulata]XP_045089331.1 uncharacterized protein LOC109754952 [Aegilops tauschii subsp. strangulata]XP_045089332.1 uncharacterized protein LOC109754952 [Aegilops tauschii subsp. strangulata]XP_045089333.1 uncharacterized protein LOC109754952 [Aegilop